MDEYHPEKQDNLLKAGANIATKVSLAGTTTGITGATKQLMLSAVLGGVIAKLSQKISVGTGFIAGAITGSAMNLIWAFRTSNGIKEGITESPNKLDELSQQFQKMIQEEAVTLSENNGKISYVQKVTNSKATSRTL